MTQKYPVSVIFLFAVLCYVNTLSAYTYNKAALDSLSVVIDEPDVMKKINTPLEIKTKFKNSGNTPLKLNLTFSSIETIEFLDGDKTVKTLQQKVDVPARGEADITVKVIGKSGTVSLHYPVYLKTEWDGKSITAVQPFESTVSPNPNWFDYNPALGKIIENDAELPLTVIAVNSGLALTDVLTYRGFWTADNDKKNGVPVKHYQVIGWNGGDVSGANVSRQPFSRSGITRQTFNMHPTWKKGPGTAGIEFRLKLPETTPITLTFFGAMRDSRPPENPTDGVTFCILAKEGQNGKFVNDKIITEQHIVASDWQEVNADLSPFAGKEILLTLTSDPGKKRDTNCDSSYWGDPVIFAGKKPLFADAEKFAEQQKTLLEKCMKAMKTGRTTSPQTRIFPLDGGKRAVVSFGQSGFLDGKIAIGSPDKFVVYDGIKVFVKDKPLTEFPTTVSAAEWIEDKGNSADAVFAWKQNIIIGSEKAVMFYSLKRNTSALQLSVDCSEPNWVSSVQLGAASEVAERVYFGHGYCIVKPKQFTIGTDGHRLSTSHVGFEYPGGLSVLQATTTPPTNLTVNLEKKIATMTIRPGTTMTLLPGTDGMFDCAIRYRAINPKKAADGVKTKAGRFCFDIWGGKYKLHSEIIDKAVLYGLTDSLFIVHSWQRYGYDNRLPDIFPPNAGHGTLEDMQETLKKCDDAGILYGVHDNYIDFYPDAEKFGLDYLSFEKNGQPRKAWFNSGVNARSYQFRPDTFKPFLERNLDLMIPALPQSCYFVDVFSSMTPVDFYDRSGVFHTRSETQKYWGECFDIIRNKLTPATRPRQKLSEEKRKEFFAPTISEAGNDFLIGHLDGADCQFGFISQEPGDFRLYIPCEDWERVPWFDAVNHTTFSLHGAGYSGRFEGGRSRLTHGIESDDYITAETMLGHPPMVDWASAFRGAVRKYYLLQPLARKLADCEIISVEYVDGNIHRQKINWKSPDGKITAVYVNRGKTDWVLNGDSIIPPFGFFVSDEFMRGGIWKTKSGDIIEGFTAGTTFYVNGRQYSANGVLPLKVSPEPNSFKYLGGNKFQCGLLWEAKSPLPLDYNVFIHLVPENWKKGDKVSTGNTEGILSVFGVKKDKPLTEWNGSVITPLNVSDIPNDLPAGKYKLLAGIYDSKSGSRPSMMGYTDENSRYCIGILNVARDTEGKINGITYEAYKPQIDEFEAALNDRSAPPKEAADVGFVKTKGAFFVDFTNPKRLTATPLPDEPSTEISLKTSLTKVSAVDKTGGKTADVAAKSKDGFLTFTTDKDVFQYIIE